MSINLAASPMSHFYTHPTCICVWTSQMGLVMMTFAQPAIMATATDAPTPMSTDFPTIGNLAASRSWRLCAHKDKHTWMRL